MTEVVNGYVTVETLKSYLGITQYTNDAQIAMAINAASRAIDSFCQRRFWRDPVPVVRSFEPQSLLEISFSGGDEQGGDLASTTALEVATDPSGKGVYDVVWASTDYQLQPHGADTAYPEPRPWTGLRAVGTKTFPWLVNTWLTRLDRIQVTGYWGWPQVPAAVAQACLIKAARLYHRKDSPQGFAGFAEFGPVRLSRGEDNDVVLLLRNYLRYPVLVG